MSVINVMGGHLCKHKYVHVFALDVMVSDFGGVAS